MFSGYRGSITKPPPGTPIDPFHPLSQGLVGYWLMNEGSGSKVYDSSGHGNHGTLMNMSTNAQNSGWGGSKFGGGLKCDGVDDYVDCGSDVSLDLTGELTMFARVWLNAKHDWQQICGRGYSGAGNYWMAFNTGTSLPYVWVDGDDFYPSAEELSLKTWHDIMFSVKTGTNNLKMFVDGRLYDQDTTSSDIIGSSIHKFQIGRDDQSDSYEIDASIAFIYTWNRALSLADAKQLHHDPFCNMLKVPIRYVAPTAGAIMNQFQRSNIGADLYNGVFAI